MGVNKYIHKILNFIKLFTSKVQQMNISIKDGNKKIDQQSIIATLALIDEGFRHLNEKNIFLNLGQLYDLFIVENVERIYFCENSTDFFVNILPTLQQEEIQIIGDDLSENFFADYLLTCLAQGVMPYDKDANRKALFDYTPNISFVQSKKHDINALILNEKEINALKDFISFCKSEDLPHDVFSKDIALIVDDVVLRKKLKSSLSAKNNTKNINKI